MLKRLPSSNYVGDNTEGFIVLIIQFAKIKEWRGELKFFKKIVL